MQLRDVIWIYRLAESNGIPLWIDGGWGVDALLGRETRAHGDLDIVIEHKHLALFVDILKDQGFQQRQDPDAQDWNFVMADPSGSKVDFHVITLDCDGNGLYGPKDHDDVYPASALAGCGTIGPIRVRCISADYQLASHNAGYPLREQDLQDMAALCSAFDLPLPERFQSALQDRGYVDP